MKYKMTDKLFMLPDCGRTLVTVRPVNGETMLDPVQVSWSHGLTHFVRVADGSVGSCGQSFFERNAIPYTE